MHKRKGAQGSVASGLRRLSVLGGAVVSSCMPALDMPSDDPGPIYRTVLSALQEEFASSGPILVDPRTYDFGGHDSLTVLPLPASVESAGVAAQALIAANQGSGLLPESVTADGPAVLLSEEVASELDRGGYMWARLREEHGEGMVVVRFSRPGIEPSAGQAMITYSWAYFIGYGEGYQAVLEWRDEAWEVSRVVSAWSW